MQLLLLKYAETGLIQASSCYIMRTHFKLRSMLKYRSMKQCPTYALLWLFNASLKSPCRNTDNRNTPLETVTVINIADDSGQCVRCRQVSSRRWRFIEAIPRYSLMKCEIWRRFRDLTATTKWNTILFTTWRNREAYDNAHRLHEKLYLSISMRAEMALEMRGCSWIKKLHRRCREFASNRWEVWWED